MKMSYILLKVIHTKKLAIQGDQMKTIKLHNKLNESCLFMAGKKCNK
jgi:hypothetical protein